MVVRIDRLALRRFKRHASAKYPNEVYAILLGYKYPNYIEIKDIVIPKIKEHAYSWVIPDYDDVNRVVAENPLIKLGDIHSHTQASSAPSQGDYETWNQRETPVMGILSIRKRVAYKTTELKFWKKKSACPIKYVVI